MAEYDGSIKFDAKLDTKELEKDLDKLGKVGKESLSKLEKPAKQASDKLDDLEQSADDAADGVGGLKSITDKVKSGLSSLKGAGGVAAAGIGAAATAAIAGAKALVNLERETREYREDIGKLEAAFETAGFSTETATKIYKDFYSVIGEEDRSVEAVNHLAKLCDNQEQLSDWTTICTGVWATFGDSLPIEGLTEAANETAKVGQVTGVLADALNWGNLAGETFGVTLKENTKANEEWNKAVSEASSAEDYFNLALSQCTTEQERQQLITTALTGAYSEAAQKYKEVNGDVMAANKAHSDWTDTMARLGEIVAPISSSMEQFASDTLNGFLDLVTGTDTFKQRIGELGDEFQNAKDKAKLTEDYIQEWQDLKTAIGDNALPADQLAAAQERIKAVEQWLIDNYGNFITAEEQKNGIREDTLDLIERQADAQEAISRYDLISNIEGSAEKIKDLYDEINNLNADYTFYQEQADEASKLAGGLSALGEQYIFLQDNMDNMSAEQYNAEMLKIADAVAALTGDQFGVASLPKLSGLIENAEKDMDYFAEQAGKTADKISENESSLASYIKQAQLLIETDLGGTYQDTIATLDLLKKAQDELNTQGKITTETYDALVQKVPDLKDNADSPEFLRDKIQEIDDKLKNADETLRLFNLRVDESSKEIVIDIEYKVSGMPPALGVGTSPFVVPGNAKGTMNAKRGLSVINERGPELIEGKDGSFRYVDSKGAALTYLNSGDRVYTAEQTKGMFGNIKRLPHFADGRGTGGTGSVDFNIKGRTTPDLGCIGEEIAYQTAEGIERGTGAVETAAEGMNEVAETAAEKLERRRREIEEEQAAYDEAQARKRYQERLEQAEDAAEREEIIAEEERRLKEKGYQEELEALQEEVEKEEKIRDQKFSDLKYYLDMGYITEAEYYKRLRELRDEYYEEGSQEYRNYTLEILNFQEEYIKEMYQNIADAADETLGVVADSQKELQAKMTDFALVSDVSIAGLGDYKKVTDLDSIIESNEAYIDELTSFRERLKAAGATDEVMQAIMGEIAGMSKKDARETMRAFAGQTDAYMAEYVADYQSLLDLAQEESTLFYAGDMKKAGEEFEDSVEEIIATAKEKGLEIPDNFFDIGALSAERFGEGFKAEIDAMFEDIKSELSAFNEYYFPYAGKFTGSGQVITNRSYSPTYNILPSAGESTQTQLAAIRNAETRERMRGGY